MKINILCIGSIKFDFIVDAINEYKKRLSRFCKLNIIELPQSKIDDSALSQKFEEQKILEKIEGYTILLDLLGEQLTSEKFSESIKSLKVNGVSTLTFIIGGSFGVSENIKNIVNKKISFSKMTFPHQLFRVMLLEQIYRAFSILENFPYHK